MSRQCNPLHNRIRYSGALLATLVAAVAAVALATSPPASTSGSRVPASLFDYDRSASRERGWIKTKNPSYWRRDAKREAMQRSRERRQRTHV